MQAMQHHPVLCIKTHWLEDVTRARNLQTRESLSIVAWGDSAYFSV